MADKIIPGPGGFPIRLVDQGDGSFAQVIQVVGDEMHKRITVQMIGGSADVAVTTAAGFLKDTRATLTPNSLVGKIIVSDGKTGIVTSNTSTQMNVASWTGGTPAAGSEWAIFGNGAVGVIQLFAITGRVVISDLYCYGAALVSPGGGTLSFGTTDAQSTPSDSVDGCTGWVGIGADVGNNISPDIIDAASGLVGPDFSLSADLFATVGTANILSGSITVDVFFHSLSDNGNLTPVA